MDSSDIKWLVGFAIIIIVLLIFVSRISCRTEVSDKSVITESVTERKTISIYDSLFIKYAKKIDWDWRLLAAISYRESGFESNVTTEDGAGGLMGIMPLTAKIFDLPLDSIIDPESNVRISVLLLERLNRRYSDIRSIEERQKFMIAAYNAGIGHIADARALTFKYGKDPDVWDDVQEYMLLLNEPEYYNDPVCRSGRFKGVQTTAYLKKVLELFEKFKLNK